MTLARLVALGLSRDRSPQVLGGPDGRRPWSRRGHSQPCALRDFLGWHLWSGEQDLVRTRGQDLGAGQLGACSVVVAGWGEEAETSWRGDLQPRGFPGYQRSWGQREVSG